MLKTEAQVLELRLSQLLLGEGDSSYEDTTNADVVDDKEGEILQQQKGRKDAVDLVATTSAKAAGVLIQVTPAQPIEYQLESVDVAGDSDDGRQRNGEGDRSFLLTAAIDLRASFGTEDGEGGEGEEASSTGWMGAQASTAVASTSTTSTSTSTIDENLSCPICGHVFCVSTEDLLQQNEHIEACLRSQEQQVSVASPFQSNPFHAVVSGSVYGLTIVSLVNRYQKKKKKKKKT